MEDQAPKRASSGDGGPPEKRLKGEPEDTEVYSQRIKKKLQANSRTGQACDRCKVSSRNFNLPSQTLTFQLLTSFHITGEKDEMRLRPRRLPTVPIEELALHGNRPNYGQYT
jgi:hypothetical protein